MASKFLLLSLDTFLLGHIATDDQQTIYLPVGIAQRQLGQLEVERMLSREGDGAFLGQQRIAGLEDIFGASGKNFGQRARTYFENGFAQKRVEVRLLHKARVGIVGEDVVA